MPQNLPSGQKYVLNISSLSATITLARSTNGRRENPAEIERPDGRLSDCEQQPLPGSHCLSHSRVQDESAASAGPFATTIARLSVRPDPVPVSDPEGIPFFFRSNRLLRDKPQSKEAYDKQPRKSPATNQLIAAERVPGLPNRSSQSCGASDAARCPAAARRRIDCRRSASAPGR
jgi:hypothetical protein